jgi:pimeloyl-ACP methyl ester carboxylesterase
VTNRKFLDLHGERIAYREEGQGSAVLLIHGMAGSSETWRAVMPRLSTRYRVIAPDLLGHGQSAKPRGDYSLGAFAVWLRDLLDELGISRVTLVGQSLGGGVAMQFVHQHPDYCERLVLIGSGGLGSEVGWPLRVLSAPGTEALLPVIAPRAVVALGERVRSWLEPLGLRSPRAGETWHAYTSLSNASTRQAFLRTLRSVVDHRGQAVSAFNRLHFSAGLPTLLIWGDHDRIIPVSHAHAAHGALPDSRLVILPGIGHYPHAEAADAVIDTFNDFFATTTPWQWRRRAKGGCVDFAPASLRGLDEHVGRRQPGST